jgi:hypothetical protein
VKGGVLIGNTELAIKSWTPITIICELPRSGATSSGDIKVLSDGGHFSNVVPLTAWHGTATYTIEEAGSLKMVMGFDFRFRGDIHGFRVQPGETPTEPGLSYIQNLTTTGNYAFSGTFADAASRTTVDWSGSGTLKAKQDGVSTDNTVSCIGGMVSGKWDMVVLAFATKGNHVHTVQRNAQGAITYDNTTDEDGFGVGNFQPPGSPFQADVLAPFNIPSGKRVMQVPSGYSSSVMATHTLEWTTFTADFAPTADTTRGARVTRKR